MKILLDYFFPITAISPTPAASTAYLKQVCVVAKPKSGQEANVGQAFLCTSMTQVAARTDNTESQQLFDAGMSRVYILLMDDLDLDAALETYGSNFFTLLISTDFEEEDMIDAQAEGVATITSYANLVSGTADTLAVAGVTFTAQAGAATPGTATFQAATSNDITAASLAAQINAHATAGALVEATALAAVVTIKAKLAGWAGNDIAVVYVDNSSAGLTLSGLESGKLAGGAGIIAGSFKGVIGVSSSNTDFLEDQAVIENRCAFFVKSANGAKSMMFAFGSLLANTLSWSNQQYIAMPVADDVDELGEANALFDSKISFVISDDEFSNRLALFACGGKAITAPYIVRNLEIDLQSRALTFISANQPTYSMTSAALLEDELQSKVIDALYIQKQLLTAGVVEILLEEDNFVASGYIDIAEPKALWRIFGQIKQTL